MKKRFITSIFIVLASVLAILSKLLPQNIGVYIFDIFVIFICYVANIEVINMMTQRGKQVNKMFSTFYVVLNYIILLICDAKLAMGYIILIQIGALLLYAFIACLVEYCANKQDGFKSAFKTAINTLLSCIYPTFLLALMLQINHADAYTQVKYFSLIFIVLVFAITMLTDTFAYLIGSAFKGPKLAPKISPNKTISGSIGGLLGGVIGAVLVFVIVRCTGLKTLLSTYNLAWWHFVLIGFVGSAVGQLGDLFESALKRKADVKDSGNIFPGHGGMLDRVDAMTFVAAFVCIVVLCVLV